MNPFEVFNSYVALKNHFTSSYDYHKYRAKVRTSYDSFKNRRDFSFFQKLSKKHDPFGLMIANFIKNPNIWVGDLLTADSEKNYYDWSKRAKALTYTIKNELGYLKEDFNDNFIVTDGQMPFIILQYYEGKISLETLVVLSYIAGTIPYWDKKIKDPLYVELSVLIKKYCNFIEYDIEKIKEIVITHFQNG